LSVACGIGDGDGTLCGPRGERMTREAFDLLYPRGRHGVIIIDGATLGFDAGQILNAGLPGRRSRRPRSLGPIAKPRSTGVRFGPG
jgi:hypothetical protein